MSIRNLIILIIVLFGLITSVIFITQPAIIGSKASSSNLFTSSSENSYIFASPIQAKANGQESIRITVFLLDSRGLGIENQNITLEIPPQLKVIQNQNLTDVTGKATFDITSTEKKIYSISAKHQNKPIGQILKISFY